MRTLVSLKAVIDRIMLRHQQGIFQVESKTFLVSYTDF